MLKPSWASAFALAALVVGGCAADSGEVADDAVLRVYVSLPLSGPSAADGEDAADGAELALADAGGEAGGLTVEAVILDGSDGERGWTPPRVAANAREAISDSTAIAYLGEFESGATRASLPITNEARMLQVSPASGASDLVSEFVDSEKASEFQPGGDRTFGRVIPSDDAQARAAARWTGELDRPVEVIDDGTAFGEGMAAQFIAEAQSIGLEIGTAASAYYGGYGDRAGLRRIGLDIRLQGEPVLMASDALLPPFSKLPPSAAALLTSAALDPSQLPPSGRQFVETFEAERGRSPGRYAAYGYEAMAVILDSIDRASDPADRSSVAAAFFETADRDSILGTYSIDEVGNTTLGRLSGYELRDGRARVAAELSSP